MDIRFVAGIELAQLNQSIQDSFADTRFEVSRPEYLKADAGLVIKKVRLKQRKDYCGNHPAECADVAKKHVQRKFLEGADWVEFNDMLNDLLDERKVSAVVYSRPPDGTTDKHPLFVRRGMHRRWFYGSGYRNGIPSSPMENQIWDGLGSEEADYYLASETTEKSFYAEGTPGVHQAHGYHCVG
jgi:hypothetical protein